MYYINVVQGLSQWDKHVINHIYPIVRDTVLLCDKLLYYKQLQGFTQTELRITQHTDPTPRG